MHHGEAVLTAICWLLLTRKNILNLIREGNDLIYNLFISIPDAILGTHVEVPTVDNNVKIKIEPGTQPGKILRLRGKGLPEVNGYGQRRSAGQCQCLDTKDHDQGRDEDLLKNSGNPTHLHQNPIKTTRDSSKG